jgi:predicted outer membrane repeat protein
MKRIPTLLAALIVAAAAFAPFGASTALAAEYTVTNLNDSGPGSLRQAILDSNASGVDDVIVIAVTGRIELVLPLPEISDDVEIIGPGADLLTIDGNGQLILEVIADATISGVTFTGGDNTFGGAIHITLGTSSLVLVESVVTGNSATFGGGIYSNGSLTVIDSTFSGNQTTSFGGAVFLTSGTASISGSTFAGNHSGAFAGAIFNQTADVEIVNSTISGNDADAFGGGIYQQNGSMLLDSVTIANNDAPTGGAIRVQSGSVEALRTIIANNSDENCAEPLNSSGNNLDDDSTCGLNELSDINNEDPLLGPLADNGGPTLTHALLEGSPAIDTGGDVVCQATDQRGVPRPQGPACDIGAFEFGFDDDDDGTFGGRRVFVNRAGALAGVLVAISQAAERNRARAAAAAPPPVPVAPPSTGEAGLAP